ESQRRTVRQAGCRVLLLEPRAESIGLIGLNPMSRRRGVEVGRAARIEVQQYLRRPEVKEELTALHR
ncbi:MAG: hypothetical protein J2P45_32475, partial [Candidatus Dormibacteraeota bacterium]|nr:hypothetical protein [Candidatus Dormibacteraeota bacterium]